jgi:hypothetical protein
MLKGKTFKVVSYRENNRPRLYSKREWVAFNESNYPFDDYVIFFYNGTTPTMADSQFMIDKDFKDFNYYVIAVMHKTEYLKYRDAFATFGSLNYWEDRQRMFDMIEAA